MRKFRYKGMVYTEEEAMQIFYPTMASIEKSLREQMFPADYLISNFVLSKGAEEIKDETPSPSR